MTLYEIVSEIQNLVPEFDEETGEILNEEELKEKFEQLSLDKNAKVENVALYVKNLNSDVDSIKEEEKALAQRRKAKEKQVEWYKQYLNFCLEGEKFETAKCSISFRKSQKVECEEFGSVPEEYLRYKEPELDKAKIKLALKVGQDVPGCKLVESVSMQIK